MNKDMVDRLKINLYTSINCVVIAANATLDKLDKTYYAENTNIETHENTRKSAEASGRGHVNDF